MLDLRALAALPESCSGWGFAVGAAAARIARREAQRITWPVGVLADATPAVRTQVAALLRDDVLTELAWYVETRDARHVERARRMAGVFGDVVPHPIAGMLAPYADVRMPKMGGDARAADRVRREQIVAAFEHERARQRRGCPNTGKHAKDAHASVALLFGTTADAVKHVLEVRRSAVTRRPDGRR